MSQSRKNGRRRITFGVQAEPKSEVFVAGGFNEWNPRKNKLMEREKKGVFTTTMLLPKGRHEYKFVVDGTWCVDPECSEWAPNGLGSLNSVITVG